MHPFTASRIPWSLGRRSLQEVAHKIFRQAGSIGALKVMVRIQNGTESPGPKPSKNTCVSVKTPPDQTKKSANLLAPWIKGSHPPGLSGGKSVVGGCGMEICMGPVKGLGCPHSQGSKRPWSILFKLFNILLLKMKRALIQRELDLGDCLAPWFSNSAAKNFQDTADIRVEVKTQSESHKLGPEHSSHRRQAHQYPRSTGTKYHQPRVASQKFIVSQLQGLEQDVSSF